MKKANKIVPGNDSDGGGGAKSKKGGAFAGAKAKAAAGAKAKGIGKKKGKKGTKGKKGAKGAVAKVPKKKVLTAEDLAAMKIQGVGRQRAAVARVDGMRERKQAYAEEMLQLKKNAFMAQVEYERKQEQKQLKKDRDLRAQREQRAKLKNDLLEASFDGEKDDVKKILTDPEVACSPKLTVDEANSKGDTPLSEASSGGDLATVQMLLELGADPNTQGEHSRTPLYRAAFAKHAAVCQTLVKAGADPRIGDKGGQTPSQLVRHHEELKL